MILVKLVRLDINREIMFVISVFIEFSMIAMKTLISLILLFLNLFLYLFYIKYIYIQM